MVLLYHYTDRAGKNGIYADQVIRATSAKDGLGHGVRFTELPHDTDKAVLIANNWGGHPPWDAKERLRFWFKFESEDLPQPTFKSNEVKGRNVWICTADVPIHSSTAPTSGPAQGGKPARTFYHYVNKDDRDAIYKRGYVEPSSKTWTPFSSSVVKLTDLEPTSDKKDIVWSVFGQKYPTSDLIDKTKYWFKFDESELRDLKRDSDRSKRLWTTPIPVTVKPATGSKSGNHPHYGSGGSASSQQKNRRSPSPKREYGQSTPKGASKPRPNPPYPAPRGGQRRSPKGGSPPRGSPQSGGPQSGGPQSGGIGANYPALQAPPPIQYNALFYYTDRAGKDAIYGKGCIEARGGCVYFTEATPAQTAGMTANQDGYWFEFPDISLAGLQRTTDPQGQVIWFVQQDVDLSLSTSQGRLTAS